MAAKKAASAADSEKKRKRQKAEDAGRAKKRKPQQDDDAAVALPKLAGADADTAAAAGPLVPAGPKGVVARAKGGRAASTWKLSAPMGGVLADVDPIFSTDEAHLLLVYHTSVQVYSTADSLLERRIPLPEAEDHHPRPLRIVAAVLSPLAPDFVWIGCADGALYRADWTSGAVTRVRRVVAAAEPEPPLAGLAVGMVRGGGDDPDAREVLYLSEGGPGAWAVTAYDAGALLAGAAGQTKATATATAPAAGHVLFTAPGGAASTAVELLRAVDGGRYLVGARGRTVFVGGRKTGAAAPAGTLTTTTKTAVAAADLAYQFYALDAPDEIASLDARTAQSGAEDEDVLELIVGGARGALYAYEDVFRGLQAATAAAAAAAAATTAGAARDKVAGVRPRKHHWHSRAVHAVKWSRDGNYFLSGGAESVLVMWQAETGKRSFLPHLGASIENVVVSPRGAAYALRLDDNSAMVVSTAEMLPTFYVSGLQSLGLPGPASGGAGASAAAHVRRVWQPAAGALPAPVPAAVHPTDPSRVWLRVGSGARAAAGGLAGGGVSASLLQTFDVAAFRSVGKQPLARSNVTEANLTQNGYPVTEPTITHLCPSADGAWLVSVDEWQPPARDMGGLPGEPSRKHAWARERREVHLKFWRVGGGAGPEAAENAETVETETVETEPAYDLVTRVDEAHFTTRAESILAVAADGDGGSGRRTRFATLGDDGVVRFWGMRTRVHDGLVAQDERGRPLVSWHCTQAVALAAEPAGSSSSGGAARTAAAAAPNSGALAFSEDGSTVFAAFGPPDEAVLYTIDAEAGAVRGALPGLVRGGVRGLAVLGAALVLLSMDLRVYDLVADELRYGVRLLDRVPAADRPAAAALTQLAVSRDAHAFVVAVPDVPGAAAHAQVGVLDEADAVTTTTTTTPGRPLTSRLAVYAPDHAQPLFAQTMPAPVVALLPAVGRSGFLAIDAAAQVWSLADAADTAALGQSLADLNLPAAAAAPAAEDEEMEDGEADEAAEEEAAAEDPAVDDPDVDDPDVHDVVIAPQRLRAIFDAAPAAAGPSIEDLFWQVSGLLAGLPGVVRAG